MFHPLRHLLGIGCSGAESNLVGGQTYSNAYVQGYDPTTLGYGVEATSTDMALGLGDTGTVGTGSQVSAER